MMKHILVLDYTHVFNDQRMLVQAEALARSGYRVTVIGTARMGKHPLRETQNGVEFLLPPFTPTYHPLKILTALWRWLRGNTQQIIPLPEDKPHKSNIVAALLYTLWALRLGWNLNYDAVDCHEHMPLVAAWILARRRRVPLVYDEHDYIDAIPYFAGWQGHISVRLEKFFLKRVDAATVIGERLAEVLRKLSVRSVVVVGNWKRLEDYTLEPERLALVRKQFGLEDCRLVISYISTFGHANYIPALLAAVEASPEVALLIGGSGPLENAVRETAARAPNIHYLGWVARKDIPLYTCAADVVYHCLDADANPQMDYAAPNKLFEALAAGKPIIARRGVGEMADIIEQNDVGILLDAVTPDTLRDAFRQLQEPAARARLSANALKARERYNWAAAEKQLQTLFEQLLERRGDVRAE
jgi:glycosyltransferase involved in cell wall biosynthesis